LAQLSQPGALNQTCGSSDLWFRPLAQAWPWFRLLV